MVEGLQQLGIKTHVWALGDSRFDLESEDAVTRSLGRFGPHRLLLNDRLMGQARNQCLLLQWEPVGFGLKSLNLPFCLWIASRVLRGSRLLVMFHESFPSLQHASIKRKMAGALQRLMAFTLVNCAETTFVSNGSGADALHKLCLRSSKVHQLPVFSNIDSNVKPEDAALVRSQFASEKEVLIGHFGRYMATTEPLVMPPLAQLLRKNHRVRILFVGECGARYRAALLKVVPEFTPRIIDAGICSSLEAAALISACDFMFQPYPGGITTKLSSAMAALANGKAVLSTDGPETEDLWRECGGAYLSKSDPPEMAEHLNQLAADVEQVRRMCATAARYYQKNFSVDRTVQAIADCIHSSYQNPVHQLIEAL